MALDNGYPFAAHALPTPTGTPYETPSRGISRQSTRGDSSSPISVSSPAPFPPGEDSYFGRHHENVDGEKISPLDPRRFTPNLHASLIQEILSLRRDVEGNSTIVENLEESLHETKTENAQLSEDLIRQVAYVRIHKKEIQTLENGTLSALEDMKMEKDEAIESLTDTRKRLEVLNRKTRSLQEDLDNSQALWEEERQRYINENRNMERRNHVAENRIKTLVGQLVEVDMVGEDVLREGNDVNEEGRELGSGRGNDTASVRSNSIRATSRLSNRSVDDSYDGVPALALRASRMSGLHGMGGSKMSGISLAEELEGEDDEHEAPRHDYNDVASPDALPEERHTSSRRYSDDEKARKLMGLPAERNEHPFGGETSDRHSMGIIEHYINMPRRRSSLIRYKDTATQSYSPTSPSPPENLTDVISETHVEQTEHAANQSRKRVAVPSVFLDQNIVNSAEAQKASIMVSTSSQTVDEYSVPAPEPEAAYAEPESAPALAKETKESSTQTSGDVSFVNLSARSRLSPPPLDVPVIEIHPPASRPSTSHTSVVLPPRTKNVACQVAIEKETRSISMQTEGIRIEKRPIRIPPQLQQLKFTTQSSSRSNDIYASSDPPVSAKDSRRKFRSPPPVESRGSRIRPPIPNTESSYLEDNDNGPLDNRNRSGPKRPVRYGSILAGFDDAAEEEANQVDDHYSDDDFVNAEPIRKTLSKVKDSWKLVPQSQDSVLDRLESGSQENEAKSLNDVPETGPAPTKRVPKTTSKAFHPKSAGPSLLASSSSSKQNDARRTALASSGSAAHAEQAKSPSVSSLDGPTVAPPFPVPTRSSSRRIPISASDGAPSPSPYTTSFFTARRTQDQGRPVIKRRALRKIKSAAAVSKSPGPHLPPPLPAMSTSSIGLASPKSSLTSRNQFILPYPDRPQVPKYDIEVSLPRSHAGEASIETANEQTSVVDAIAQTMVGEWMWKSVRKKTFGISETPQPEFDKNKSGDDKSSRHKRWVWLAPYERAVMWSNKQPTSGPALLGKGSRKLTIQSVHDVKDDTLGPKGSRDVSVPGRSILIITPQRALKFTAISSERHYIWLTALSFLSHSTEDMDNLASPPPILPQEYQIPTSPNLFSFRSTRDSITVAKGKSRPDLGTHSHSSPPGELRQQPLREVSVVPEDNERLSEEAAEPPQVPRVHSHARKRSNTAPRPIPMSTFNSHPMSSGTTMSFSMAQHTAREKYDKFTPRSRGSLGANTMGDTTTRRTTESSIGPEPLVRNDFIDAIGTIRMEAFVDRKENQPVEKSKGKKESRSYRTRQGRKKDLSYWGTDDLLTNREPRRKGEDPFRGF